MKNQITLIGILSINGICPYLYPMQDKIFMSFSLYFPLFVLLFSAKTEKQITVIGILSIYYWDLFLSLCAIQNIQSLLPLWLPWIPRNWRINNWYLYLIYRHWSLSLCATQNKLFICLPSVLLARISGRLLLFFLSLLIL